MLTVEEKLDQALEGTFPASDAFCLAPDALRFPVGAVASIGHRISGVVLVGMLPFSVLALERIEVALLRRPSAAPQERYRRSRHPMK